MVRVKVDRALVLATAGREPAEGDEHKVLSNVLQDSVATASGEGGVLAHVAALPAHLRQSILWFLVRTGQEHREDGFCLTDNMLVACVRGFTHLDLGGTDFLGGVTAFDLVRACCPDLAALQMQRWKRRDSIEALASGHAKLREINLARCVGSLSVRTF